MNHQPLHFLLAEDDDAQAELVALAFEDNRIANHLDRVCDGVEALAYLRREPPFADAPRPDILLLDLNMPKKGGLEVLSEIKEDADLCTIPVVILTTSTAESDKARAYRHHANSFITKPVDFDQFHTMIKDLNCYWTAWNQRLESPARAA